MDNKFFWVWVVLKGKGLPDAYTFASLDEAQDFATQKAQCGSVLKCVILEAIAVVQRKENPVEIVPL